MSKEQKIEVIKRLMNKGFEFEAEIACEEWHISKKLLARGNKKGGKK